MSKRHKHADLIHAWAEGTDIQFKYKNGEWFDLIESSFEVECEFRIKPKEPEWYENIPTKGVLCWVGSLTIPSNKSVISVVVEYNSGGNGEFCDYRGISWCSAIPLTNEEIEGFKR